jgi:hypothetical protein
MQAGIFELIYTYVVTTKKEGKPPSIYRLAQIMGVDRTALLDRRKMAYQGGIIEQPPNRKAARAQKDWCRLTPEGARQIGAILDRRQKVVFSDKVLISRNPECRPKGVIYCKISDSEYSQQAQKMKSGEPAFQY